MASPTVLVVDDEPRVLRVINRMLTRAGYNVCTAARPGEALELLGSGAEIHLVISDIDMPEMDGTALVREALRISPNTACLLMSGGGYEPLEMPPGVPVLQKPFSLEDLLSTVQSHFGTRSTEQQHVSLTELREDLERKRRDWRETLRLVNNLIADVPDSVPTSDGILLIEQAGRKQALAYREYRAALAKYNDEVIRLTDLRRGKPEGV